MTLSRDEVTRLHRLRDLFLDDQRGAGALPDYWRDTADLRAYDDLLGARIGWKWDAVLAECQHRGLPRTDDCLVLDYGCGTGIAARRFCAWFGAREVRCHDRSVAAMQFAVERLRSASPPIPARPQVTFDGLAPDVLLVSHVLGELDARGRETLRALIAKSQLVVLVEPGNRASSRALSQLRDELLPGFHVLAPCPHASACPVLANANDWCHFFAPPPPEVFTDGHWVKAARELGIDLRALPYSFVALSRQPPAAASPTHRVLGRAEVGKHAAILQVCAPDGLRTVAVTKRHDPTLWRKLRKDPALLRHLPEASDGPAKGCSGRDPVPVDRCASAILLRGEHSSNQ